MPGVPEHLIVRGIDRKPIFRSDSDRILFHRCLCGYAEKLGIAIHAYVLMPNHVHLLATGPTLRALSKLFAGLGRKYVSHFNYVYKRTGTLWQGRFRSFPVQSERYLLTCQRYIELNPVRAAMVAAPGEFPWSSHRFYAEDRPDDAVTPHRIYRGLGRDANARRAAYLSLFEEAMARETLQQIRHCVNYGWALGTGSFCDRLELASGRPAKPRMRGVRKRKDADTPHP
jgi:putative transposase